MQWCQNGSSTVKFLSLLLVCAYMLVRCNGHSFSMEMIHRFSDKARDIIKDRHGVEFASWPAKGSLEYYQMLKDHDQSRHRDRILLAPAQNQYTYAEGNITQQLFGALHYSVVDVGTPNVSFLVALDTGSDLFWVPCQCIACAPTAAPYYAPEINTSLSVYDPSASSTYKPVSCSSKLCEKASTCSSHAEQCPYEIDYVSANTSTVGKLVEDVIYLIPEKGGPVITDRITFGCGQNQSGSFLQGAAPDGLLGLGLSDISVPSTLAKTGAVKNSFSMCFDLNGSGRVVFGDTGTVNQARTPFLKVQNQYVTYYVEVTNMMMGAENVAWGGAALIDTGTSYTYLATSVYQLVVTSFSSQVNLPLLHVNGWDVCYATTDPNTQIPTFTLVLGGGPTMDIVNPILGVYDGKSGNLAGFCLAIISGGDLSIIGQNFLANYSIVFDRESMQLGWQSSDCYTTDQTGTPSTTPAPTTSPSAAPPAKSPGTNSTTPTPAPPSPDKISPPPKRLYPPPPAAQAPASGQSANTSTLPPPPPAPSSTTKSTSAAQALTLSSMVTISLTVLLICLTRQC